ncbi:MAG TPA: hypothetical protein VJI98_01330 [Candidatus Nanoarchaeia archaeon]|nr:hypothetical protein [Candidatus Nanoarchaeia archaeon]
MIKQTLCATVTAIGLASSVPVDLDRSILMEPKKDSSIIIGVEPNVYAGKCHTSQVAYDEVSHFRSEQQQKKYGIVIDV